MYCKKLCETNCMHSSAYKCTLCSEYTFPCTDFEEDVCTVKNKRNTISCNRTKLFYCDPSATYQKGACEVNHELIRRILPQESSFDELTQQDIILMMNHINSYKRKKLNNRSPYETFSFYYGEDVLKKLGCSPVAAENIILKPKLLKK